MSLLLLTIWQMARISTGTHQDTTSGLLQGRISIFALKTNSTNGETSELTEKSVNPSGKNVNRNKPFCFIADNEVLCP